MLSDEIMGNPGKEMKLVSRPDPRPRNPKKGVIKIFCCCSGCGEDD
ncbi:hypothetical protein Hdeb2414_s0016g00490671 [Helianthus debilis subsp. tardiflorus]